METLRRIRATRAAPVA